MSEPRVIPLPDGDDEGADEVLSLDKLSDAQLAALSNEEIQHLELDQRKQFACRLLVANEQRAHNDPEYTTLGWIADRVGVDVRVLYRWRTDSSWSSLLEAERERAESYIGDLRLSSRRGRMKALQEMFDDPTTPGSVRLKIAHDFDREAKEGSNTAVDGELQGARERMRKRILQINSRLPEGPPRSSTRRNPSPSEPNNR